MPDFNPLRKAYSGDTETAAAQIGTGRTHLDILKNQMQLGNQRAGVRTVQLPDGTTIRVSSIYGQDRIDITTTSGGQAQVSAPSHYVPPEPPPPVLPYIGAVCDSGNPAFWLDNTVEGTEQSGTGADARILSIRPCPGDLAFTTVADCGRADFTRGRLELIMTVQFYDLHTTFTGQPHNGITGITSTDTYNTFDGSQFVINWNDRIGVPLYATSDSLPLLYKEVPPPANDPYDLTDAAGNPVTLIPGMQILKWSQTSGNMPMLPFTIEGGKHPTALRNAVPIQETFTIIEQPVPGFTIWQGAPGGSEGWLFQEYYLMGSYYQVFNPEYSAKGVATVMDLAGVATAIPVSVTARYDRSTPLIFIQANAGGSIGPPTGNTKDGVWAPGDAPLLPNSSWNLVGPTPPVYPGPNGFNQN